MITRESTEIVRPYKEAIPKCEAGAEVGIKLLEMDRVVLGAAIYDRE